MGERPPETMQDQERPSHRQGPRLNVPLDSKRLFAGSGPTRIR